MTHDSSTLIKPASPVRLSADEKPILVVVIDTEEEFDWNAPFDRQQTPVEAMRGVNRIQPIFDQFGVRPVYAIDYPVATTPSSIDILKPIVDDGRAVLASHVHPWVNPPHEEEVNNHNSFPGHLPRQLELEKLRILTDEIEANFGVRPKAYKAGRYGVGEATESVLAELGFEVDLSTCPPLDVRDRGGRDYTHFPIGAWWFGGDRQMLEIPHTGAFIGFLHGMAGAVFPAAKALEKLKATGILARLGALDRLRLSPEGFPLHEHIKLTDALLKRGERIFCYSFHSPSLEAGYTPYVKNADELQQFLDSVRDYCDYFVNQCGGVCMTPDELRHYLLGRV